jgi:hypothetical protein
MNDSDYISPVAREILDLFPWDDAFGVVWPDLKDIPEIFPGNLAMRGLYLYLPLVHSGDSEGPVSVMIISGPVVNLCAWL